MALTVDYKECEVGLSTPNLYRVLSHRCNPTMRTFGKIAASVSAFLGFQTPMAVFRN